MEPSQPCGALAQLLPVGARARRFVDLRQLTGSELAQFAAHPGRQTQRGMSIGYAKNQLTSVNVALESLRVDRALWVKPGAFLGHQSAYGSVLRLRSSAASSRTLSRCTGGQVRAAAIEVLSAGGQVRVAAVALLRRALASGLWQYPFFVRIFAPVAGERFIYDLIEHIESNKIGYRNPIVFLDFSEI